MSEDNRIKPYKKYQLEVIYPTITAYLERATYNQLCDIVHLVMLKILKLKYDEVQYKDKHLAFYAFLDDKKHEYNATLLDDNDNRCE